ncbi:MAG: hypothetical protein LAO21_03120 [Acidobacteriia bacterium]|nr:hypothetical protein [Terriglobia bacterium]
MPIPRPTFSICSRVLATAGVAGAAFYLPLIAWGQSEDSEYEKVFDCPGFPRAGADTLAVRVKEENGSFGYPVLVGLKAGQVVWKS